VDDRLSKLTEALFLRTISRRDFLEQAGALGLAASSASALLAACAPAAPRATSPGAAAATGSSGAKKTLTVAVEADISSMRPDRFGPFVDRYANRTLYDVLLHFGTKQTPQGLWYDAENYEFRIASGMDGKKNAASSCVISPSSAGPRFSIARMVSHARRSSGSR